MRQASRAIFSDRRLAAILVSALAILLVVSGFAVANFLSVAQVHGTTRLDASLSVGYLGLSANGTLEDSGTVRAWINVTAVNPSSRGLVFNTVIYKAWIEDRPREAGLLVGRTDVPVQDQAGTRWFTIVYRGSNASSPVRVPAGGQATSTLVLDLTRPVHPNPFAAVQNITNFAVAHGGSTVGVPWLVYVVASLDIDGVPPPSSPTADLYLIDVARVVLVQGVDYGG